jgi:hypothetical protein
MNDVLDGQKYLVVLDDV